MFWKKKIKVRFIDADSGQVFERMESPPDQLPESFEVETALNMRGEDWRVVSADPKTRADFVRSGELALTLRKVVIAQVAPRDILFSLPTICDVLPALAAGSSKLGLRVLELHEDHWRQIELIERALEPQIEAELACIRRIYTEERVAEGPFKKLHVRSAIAAPLASATLDFDAARRAFATSLDAFNGLGFEGTAGLIEGGFAIATPSGTRIYGTEQHGALTALALLTPRRAEASCDARALAALMQEHALVLVDWCSARVLRSANDVDAYLRATE